jgi:hypothetical protein
MQARLSTSRMDKNKMQIDSKHKLLISWSKNKFWPIQTRRHFIAGVYQGRLQVLDITRSYRTNLITFKLSL